MKTFNALAIENLENGEIEEFIDLPYSFGRRISTFYISKNKTKVNMHKKFLEDNTIAKVKIICVEIREVKKC